MHEASDASTGRRLRIGSLFSGYGGLDLAIEEVFAARTVWFSEINEPVARVFAHHWPGAPNLGDITTIDWKTVEPVDIICGGFPCQDVSTVGKRAGLAPGTRSGLWAHMATAIDALQPEWVIAENVRGLLSAAAVRAAQKGDTDELRNPATATREDATLRDVEPDPWGLGDQSARPLRALGAVLGDLADLGYDTRWLGIPASAVGAPIPDSASSSSPTALFRTPLASDSARGGETLDHVRARRGTIALSHQIITSPCITGDEPSRRRRRRSRWSRSSSTLGTLRLRYTTMGTDYRTSLPSLNDTERGSRSAPPRRFRRMAHGVACELGH
jgi:hypothetical protein